MKRIDMIEGFFVIMSMLFVIAISLYHVSFNGYLGLSDSTWGTIWAISENGFSLMLCSIIVLNTSGMIRQLFSKVFIPYFVLKLVYHISCYSGLYLFKVKTWENIWSTVLVLLFVISFIYLWVIIRKRHV